ncbi:MULTISPECIES: polysaccharide biosynthesis tyrosine autokinase [unclassified Cryobacterium]|uniref:polysaccharide biosynthesis tyrosine autokinase n=1 Tax=unclassified Cryobacterium TaxID=2649013 RepID=UPI002AB524CC|nr:MULTISPECIES: polysaccharide biosynthesis tyrosine autokinase [unclassified Cryobacterium]MDY7526490.1 polysaccharide biosynthesis tyrosine autokinase [Cryobacterium sp. 10C2]MEB0002618.1 polysaccharide biosynthesis tyrosine autokinase [Cryobacterium sp. RTC2.1]MEB0201618.1 polysaccharide biosynthesis tyrosine autokinase [Cryobacterium sp. 5I3]MEB0285051.1 polysaccharide biosynthesis tyrosine autokinase [Cryobacterium sp. 10S3]MEB0289848.1 polysaccharide biosynthesis tyrosine autokinase [Cr
MELRDYIRVLRKSWVLIVLLLLVGLGAGATYSLTTTPLYNASSKVFVSTQGGGTSQELAQGNTFTVARVKTYADLVATPIVLLPVIGSLGLNMTSVDLAKQVTASAPLDTSIIEIAVLDPDPVRAADIANAASQSLTAVVQSIETPEAIDAVSPVKLTRAQEATVPSKPVSPNVPLNIALGALIGLALGIGLAVLREAMETRIRNERDVEQVTDVPILGGIVFDPKAKERPLIVHVDPRSPRAESFRSLRTNLQFLDVGRTERSFVITSSIESEGKSTTGANLAIALADAGGRVLLIDADLRRPKIADYMGVEGRVGLTDVLIGRAELSDVIQPWGEGRLFVLPAGKIPPNPSELLGSARMADLIAQFNLTFDVVIFDSSPLLPVTDAAILAKNVGGAIIVVAAGRTHKNQLRGAIAALGSVGAPVSGLVLTMLPTKGPDAYGYGHYGYGYGYGYTQDVTDEKVRSRARIKKV